MSGLGYGRDAMPFKTCTMSGLRICVIGAGVSGLSAAWLLAREHDVTLYESEERPGGHCNTVEVDTPEGPVAVDAGFIVFTPRTYPNFTEWLRLLGVETQYAPMSFSVSFDSGAYEYSGNGLSGLFGQRRNLIRPRHWRMTSDILHFFRKAEADLSRDALHGLTLGHYLRSGRFGETFIMQHILPMAAAIWSAPCAKVLDFPATSFVRFFANHGMLQTLRRPKWLTVKGGSRAYVETAVRESRLTLRTGCAIRRVVRKGEGRVIVFDGAGQQAEYDHAVIATHADEALRLLQAPTAEECDLLGAFGYSSNRAVLHTDESFMPKRRRLWSSWNYIGEGEGASAALPCVTYWLNNLHALKVSRNIFLTLNPMREPNPHSVLAHFRYTHPIFNDAAMRAQARLARLQGTDRVWFAGSYFGYGFHEDGVQSGLAVAEMIGGVRRPWSLAEPADRIAPLGAEPYLAAG